MQFTGGNPFSVIVRLSTNVLPSKEPVPAADAPTDTLAYPQAPTDMYSAEGHWGQMISIIPSRKLVVARVGNDRDPTWDANATMQFAVEAIDKRGK